MNIEFRFIPHLRGFQSPKLYLNDLVKQYVNIDFRNEDFRYRDYPITANLIMDLSSTRQEEYDS